MSKMTVSVVIAAYKGEKYIGEQLRSLFAQTCKPVEILIGDDSPDTLTAEVVNAVSAEAPSDIRVDYCKNAQQLGVVQNFSALAERACGDIIFFCDQDDIWLEKKIETMLDAFIQNPDCDLVACDSMRVTADLQPLQRLSNPQTVSPSNDNYFPKIWTLSGTFAGHNLALRNKGQVKDCMPFPQNFYGFHDLWLLLYFGIQKKIFYVNQVLTLYRIHDANLSAPPLRGYNKNLFIRFHEIREKTVADFELNVTAYTQFQKLLLARLSTEQIPVDNLSYMNNSLEYYKWRLANYKSPRIVRVFRLLFHIPEYFKYSNGIRSIIRDCLF